MDPATLKLLASVGQKTVKSPTVRRLVALSVLFGILGLVTVVLAPMILVGQISQASRASQESFQSEGCEPELGQPAARTIGGLTREQVRNAATIVQVSRRLKVPTGAIVVALAAALQESGLRNLNYGDRDSLGLFQQRPSSGWGTPDEIRDPARAVAAFYGVARHTSNPGLLDLRGWQSMSVGAAAQAVQRSAFPNAYDDNEPLARRLVSQLGGVAPTGGVVCGAAGAMQCPPSGSSAEQGLHPDALRVIRCIHQRWPQIRSWAGVGSRPGESDHPAGNAVDAMIPGFRSSQGVALGNEIAAWLLANRKQLGVKYVIWNTRIWSVAHQTEGWRRCGTPNGPCYAGPNVTAAHKDHVHISTYGDLAGSDEGDPATPAATGRIVLPVKSYRLTAGFGQCGGPWSHCHTGQDFATHGGTRIRAVMDGVVAFVGWGGAYGNLTKIRHANGTSTWYAHQLRQVVQVGQRVAAGQTIGYVGWTGNVRPRGPGGAHLHLEIRRHGNPTDPLKWFRARGIRA